jgi:hypothetical protein
MVHVGIVRVRMTQRRVLVVFVVRMRVGMRHRLVVVRVVVPLGQVQPDANARADAGQQQWRCDRLAQEDRQQRTQERCHREVGAVRAVPRWHRPTTNSARLTP